MKNEIINTTDEVLRNAILDGIREGVKQKFTSSYNSPLTKLIDAAIETQSAKFQEILETSMASCLGDDEFRESVAVQVRHVIAKQLVQKFGGELEKRVNALKSDPTTRARITLAIEEIVKTASA